MAELTHADLGELPEDTGIDTDTSYEVDDGGDGGGGRRRLRRVLAGAATALAGLIVFVALVVPNDPSRITPRVFVRIPAEALVAAALLLVLPVRLRRAAGALIGLGLALLTLLKILDMGFYVVFDRAFDPVLDRNVFGDAVAFAHDSTGIPTFGTVVGGVLLVAGLVLVMVFSVLRLTRLMVRHRSAAAPTVGVAGIVWIVCAAMSFQLVPGVRLATDNAASLAYRRVTHVRDSMRDKDVFAAQIGVDKFKNTPGNALLNGLRGKDVVISFVESYGRDAVTDPEYATQINAVLAAGTTRLKAAGFSSRSAFLTSPTSGGGSWRAHSTLLSGMWVDNQQRYRTLTGSNRLTLVSAFGRAGWDTVSVEPAVVKPWPEGRFYQYKEHYDARNLGYQGPRFNYTTMPDQYTMSAFQRAAYGKANRSPLMAEITLLSSHAPWSPIPKLIDWEAVGNGSAFNQAANREGDPAKVVWRNRTRVRTAYRRSIEYTLNTLISYVTTYGDKNLVFVFLGDHQPSPVITGGHASKDVPITIVTQDQGVLKRIAGWGWQDGLKPSPNAPVWRMDTFRDRFLTTFAR